MKLFDENEAVANVLFTAGPTDTSATAKLCLMYRMYKTLKKIKLSQRTFEAIDQCQ